MSGTINLALTQQFDSNGEPLSGGRLFFFAAGTSTPQNAFQDTALTIVHPNPLILDSSGRVPMFYLADGSIKVRLENDSGLTIFAADNLLVIGPSSGGGGGGGGTDATTVMQTGDVKARFGTGSHTGFVRCNGNTIGNSASSSSELADATAEQLFKYLWTTALPMLTSGGGAAVKTTAAADWLGNNRMTLPDLRGRAIAGMDDMGAAAASRLTASFWGAAATALGNAGGSESKALLTANIPSHTHGGFTNPGSASHIHTGTTNSMNSNQTHHHAYGSGAQGGPSGGGSLIGAGLSNLTDDTSVDHTHNFTTDPSSSTSHTHAFTTDGGSGTTGSAHAIASPSMVMTFYIKL